MKTAIATDDEHERRELLRRLLRAMRRVILKECYEGKDRMKVHIAFGVVPPSAEGQPAAEVPGPGPLWRETFVEDVVAWPPEELHKGVGSYRIQGYGDDAGKTAYMEVAGTDKEAVGEMWVRLAKTVKALLNAWWDEMPEACHAVIHHGPGHQTISMCEAHGKHDEHYVTQERFTWTGDEPAYSEEL